MHLHCTQGDSTVREPPHFLPFFLFYSFFRLALPPMTWALSAVIFCFLATSHNESAAPDGLFTQCLGFSIRDSNSGLVPNTASLSSYFHCLPLTVYTRIALLLLVR